MSDQQHDESNLRLPSRLERELKAIYTPPRVIPSSVDHVVLQEARRRFKPSFRANSLIQFPRWLAAAAAVVLGALVASMLFSPARRASHVREDINADGRIDILDAFALARQLEKGEGRERNLDFNGDGVVDQKDVEAIAARAVKLERERG